MGFLVPPNAVLADAELLGEPVEGDASGPHRFDAHALGVLANGALTATIARDPLRFFGDSLGHCSFTGSG